MACLYTIINQTVDKMSKPILIIRNPSYDQNLWRIIDRIINELKEDYYVIALHSTKVKEIDFECFYEKDFNTIRYEELKEMIKQSIKQ